MLPIADQVRVAIYRQASSKIDSYVVWQSSGQPVKRMSASVHDKKQDPDEKHFVRYNAECKRIK